MPQGKIAVIALNKTPQGLPTHPAQDAADSAHAVTHQPAPLEFHDVQRGTLRKKAHTSIAHISPNDEQMEAAGAENTITRPPLASSDLLHASCSPWPAHWEQCAEQNPSRHHAMHNCKTHVCILNTANTAADNHGMSSSPSSSSSASTSTRALCARSHSCATCTAV